MPKLYKLTDQDGYTRRGKSNQCLWGEGVSHSGTGEGDLCGPGFVHAYEHPLLAVLLNPIHANLSNPRLWEAKGKIAKSEGQLKCGCVTLTTVKEIVLPTVTNEQRIRFAILCAKEVCTDKAWNLWADNWLSGKDRTAEAARAAWTAAQAAEAARAAWTAAQAARVAWTAKAAAEAAAEAAAKAAAEAAKKSINLIAIAKIACDWKETP